MTAKSRYIVQATDRRCIIREKSRPDIPLLLRADGLVVEQASDWLRHIALSSEKRSGELTGTADQYARILQSFWSYLDAIGVDWTAVRDSTLEGWATEQQSQRRPPLKTTINTRLGVVVRFYRWAERIGTYPGQVDVVQQLPGGGKIRPDITLVERSGPGGRKVLVPAVQLTGSTERLPRETPTRAQADQMESAVRRQVKVPELKDRNVLILRWAGCAGCRRKELASLKIGQFRYNGDELKRLRAAGLNVTVRVATKGRSWREVQVPHELLRATIHFIETSRANLINRIKERDPHFRDPQWLFIDPAGNRLALNSMSKIATKAVRAVGLKRASLHRLRALYAFETFRSEYSLLRAKGVSPNRGSLLARIADRMGHAAFRSLEPYLLKVEQQYSHSDFELAESIEAHRALERLRELARMHRDDPAGIEANAESLLRDLVSSVNLEDEIAVPSRDYHSPQAE